MTARSLHSAFGHAIKSTTSTRLRRLNVVVMLSAAKHLAAAATHRLVPLGYRRCLQELPLACGERVTFLTGKVTKAMSARGDGRRAGARRLPCAACRPRAGANSPIHGLEHARLALAPVCAARRRPRARKIKSSVSEPSIHGTVFPARPLLAERSIGSFSPPSARRTPEGSARRASARGKATRLRPAKGRRAEPNALGRSRGRGDLASARCASLGTLARRTPGMVIGAPRRRPRTRAAGATAGGCFFGHFLSKESGPLGGNRAEPGGVPMLHARAGATSNASLRTTAKTGAPGARHEGSARR